MNAKVLLKSALRATGLFPIARQAYRRFKPEIRRQKHREIAFYRELLSHGDLCFDIGANLGQKTEIFLAADANVVSVEPNPSCWPDLDFQFKRHPRVKIEKVAIGEREGSAMLNANGSGAAASLLPLWNKSIYGPQYQTTEIEVPLTTLDVLIRKYGTPSYIKLDIEGYEEGALKGLSSRVPIVSFEFFHRHIEAISNCLSLLSRLGAPRVRYCDMNCNWFANLTRNTDDALADIKARQLDGDMFVWID